MSPRERRLRADQIAVKALASEIPALSFDCEGDPADRYLVAFTVDGLQPGAGGRPVLRREHRVALYLPVDYPRRPPLVIWQTPVFHPNLLGPDQHGGVCIGSWSPQESLSDLIRRLVDLAAWRSFGLSDALNDVAASWARARDVSPGASMRELVHAP